MSQADELPIGKMLFIGLPLGLALITSPMLVEDVGPDELTVIQAPVSGKLTWGITPGWMWQGYGSVTTYPKRISFKTDVPVYDSARKVVGGGIELRFSDGGHGRLFGSVQFALPTDEQTLNQLNANYHGADAVRKNLIENVVNNAVYLSGTLMTSKESYAEKRNDLIHYIQDQIQNGVYRTRQDHKWVKDEITGSQKEVVTAEILLDKDGKPERQEESILNKYGIHAYNFTIESLPYDDAIEAQIKQQQAIAMDVQTSIAQAKKSEQNAITAEADGRAAAARAKWEQEAVKASAVTAAEAAKAVAQTKAEQEKAVAETNAQRDKDVQELAAQRDKNVAEVAANQRLAVAQLDQKAAEAKKAELTLLGEGEAARKKAVIEADGALQQKLDAWVQAQQAWAGALAKHQGAIVPSTIMGGGVTPGQAVAGNGVAAFMDLLTANAAKQLSLDLGVRK